MNVKMRAKLRVGSVGPVVNETQILNFFAVGPKDGYPGDGSDENNSYARWSPSASLQITVANPALHDQFAAGEEYYVDFRKAGEPTPVAVSGLLSVQPRIGLTFGAAIEALKSGQRVCRAGWNGKGMYLWLLPAATVKAEWCREEHLRAVAVANGGEIEALGSIRMMTADRKVLTGWLASQTDILAEDWTILDDSKVMNPQTETETEQQPPTETPAVPAAQDPVPEAPASESEAPATSESAPAEPAAASAPDPDAD